MDEQSSTTPTNQSPAMRPMEQAPMPEVQPAESKKKKTGIIIGIVAVIIVAIIGGITAAVAINANRGNPVERAIAKIMDGDIPENLAVDGTITISSTAEDAMISDIKIDLKSEILSKSLINSSVAKVHTNIPYIGEISLEISEIYAVGGDLYFKIDGATETVEKYLESIADGADPSVISIVSNVAELIDGEWLKVSIDEGTQLLQSSGVATIDEKCTSESFIKKIDNYKNSIAEIYSRSPFITATTENVTVASKNTPVYQVLLDKDNLNIFADNILDSALVKEMADCANSPIQNNSDEAVDNLVANMPDLYVEVDKDDNFTRLYSDVDIENAGMEVVVDLNLSYPENINVAEPLEYQDYKDVLMQIFRMTGVSGIGDE